jgi:hypothetical protein
MLYHRIRGLQEDTGCGGRRRGEAKSRRASVPSDRSERSHVCGIASLGQDQEKASLSAPIKVFTS